MFNRVILIGNLTRDPELRYTPQGTSVCSFGLAVNEKRKKGEEWEDKVNFIDITVFGKQADACGQYLAKGSQVLIDGKFEQQRWTTDDGQKRSKIKVIAHQVKFFGGKCKEGDTAPPDETAQPEPF